MYYVALLLALPLVAPQQWSTGGDLFGVSLATADDLDGDGLLDLWVGDATRSRSDTESQRVWAVSTGTGLALRSIRPPSGALDFGWTLEALPDIDDDGVSDVAISSSTYVDDRTSRVTGGRVFLFSGASGVELCRFEGPRDQLKMQWFSAIGGPTLARVGDWNGDGRDDLAIGWSLASGTARENGRVDVVSMRDGGVICSLSGSAAHDRLGFALCALPDQDGDGERDLAVSGVPEVSSHALEETTRLDRNRCGYVRIVGSKGSTLRTIAVRDGSVAFGGSLTVLTDPRRVEPGRLVVGAPFDSILSPALTIVELDTSRMLLRVERPELADFEGSAGVFATYDDDGGVRRSFGTRILCVPDRDGDGRADLLVTVPQAFCRIPAGVVSSATGAVLGRVDLSQFKYEWSHVGIGAVVLGDVDEDSVDDFALSGSSVRCSGCDGSVVIVSGSTLQPIRAILRRDVVR